MSPVLDIQCGPLVRYVQTDYSSPDAPVALYTVMIVANDVKSDYASRPRLQVAGINTDTDDGQVTTLTAIAFHKERGFTFWRWNVELTLIQQERRLAYTINGSREDLGFWVPAANQPMRIMFYSCNGNYYFYTFPDISGFSQSVHPEDLSGPDPLWSDVLRQHKSCPWHVMLGGGDQIYNDGLAKKSKLFKAWLQISNLHHKFNTPYTKELADEIEEFYLFHYCEVGSLLHSIIANFTVVPPRPLQPR